LIRKTMGFPMEKSFRVMRKILKLLEKKTKSPLEGYIVLRLASMWMEEWMGLGKMPIEEEDELRKLIRESLNPSPRKP
jgi:hypothetical protein